MFATSYEILIKTEPFLNFKKELYRKLVGENDQDSEVIRRKFYRFMDDYLKNSLVEQEFYGFDKFTELVEMLDDKFKRFTEGAFIKQGENIGYIENGKVRWVRFIESTDLPIEPFLPKEQNATN